MLEEQLFSGGSQPSTVLPERQVSKGVLVGVGQVGMACAYAMLIENTLDELVLVDVNQAKVEGEVMDLTHGLPFVEPTLIRGGTAADATGADVVIITAGAKQNPGETRLDLIGRNYQIFKHLIPTLVAQAPNAIYLLVSNPVDVMTYLTLKISGLPHHQVLGTGTVLDTARFRTLLAQRLKLDPRSVHAYIIGEHGDSEVPVWSGVHVAGSPLRSLLPHCGLTDDPDQLGLIFDQVRNAAYEIIQRKGATSYAIGLGVTQIVQAILRNQNRVLTVSSYLTGQYGLRDLCLSLPTVINRHGAGRTVNLSLTPLELSQLQHSAQVLGKALTSIES